MADEGYENHPYRPIPAARRSLMKKEKSKYTESMEYTSDELRSVRETNSSDTDNSNADTCYDNAIWFCEVCDGYGKQPYINEAYFLCEQCKEKLCTPCLSVHHRDERKKEHLITPLKERADRFLRKLKCNSHPDSNITFFCEIHREIICILCKTDEKHDACEDRITNIDSIYNAASGIDINPRVAEEKIKCMTCLSDELSRLEGIVTDHVQDLCTKREVVLQKLRNLHDKTKNVVDSSLQRANDKIVNTLCREGQLVKKKETDIKKSLPFFEEQVDQFTKLLETGTKEEIFIMQTYIKSYISKYEHLFEDLQEPCNKTFAITGRPNVDALLKEIHVTEKLTVRESIVTEKLELDNQQAVCIGELDLSSFNASQIVGMVILPNGDTLICDKTTNMVIMLCSDYTILAKIKLDGQPSSMAVLNNKTIVVSLPNKCCIQFAEIDDHLNLVKGLTKQTKIPCLLISQYDKEIIAIGNGALSKCIVRMDANGNITSHKPIYVDNENCLENIQSMTVCPLNEIMYITEKTQGCVGISITDEVTVFKYTETQFTSYTGLTMHSSGSIFIGQADKIVAIHPGYGQDKDDPANVNNIVALEGLRPSCIAYGSFKRILAVHTQSRRNIVRVFKLI